MLDKSDEQRVCNLLTEAITMLCRNGLAYQRELSIEGLLGITLDKQSVVLVNIKQTINLEPELDCMPQVEDDVAERPVTPTYKSPRRTPDSSRSRSTKRRRCDISSSAQSEMPDTFDESVPTIVLDQEEEDEQVDAVEIKTEVIEKVECNDHSTAEPCMSQMNSQLSNRLADTSQYGGHVETDVSIDAGASWDFAGVAAMSNMNTSGYGGLCASQVTALNPLATHQDASIKDNPAMLTSSWALEATVKAPMSLQSCEIDTPTQQQYVTTDAMTVNYTTPLNAASTTVSNSTSASFACSVCGKQLSCLNALRLHEQRHQGVYPYYCSYCGKGFANRYNLSGHIVRHTNVREHKCEQCGLEFVYQHSLERHVQKAHSVADAG